MQDYRKFINISYLILLGLIFILAIYLRTKVYLVNQSFWHDECALAWNIINKGYTELFQPLRFLQAAPVLFLIFSKFIINNFGVSELSFRLLPFISGILSIPAFYFLSRKILNNKFAILSANLIFATCLPLYYYSAEFKPYSTDVLLCILSAFIFYKLNKNNLLLFSLLLSAFIWFSFPSVFILTAISLLIVLSKNYKIKEKVLFTLPLVINSIAYYYLFFGKILSAQKLGMTNYWKDNFVNVYNFSHLVKDSFDFMFSENSILIFLALLGLLLYIKDNNKFFRFSFVTILVVILASMMNLYPFSSRLILFLCPIYILLISKVADNNNIVIRYCLSIALLIGIYPQIKYTLNTTIAGKFHKNNTNPREMTEYLSKHFNNNDIIYVNLDSNSDYLYYKQIFNIDNRYYINDTKYLKKNDNVWFFLINKPQQTYENIIKKDYHIIYENKSDNSALIYAQKIK